jgi:RimJ/RimL family protein N-acetyltransferase
MPYDLVPATFPVIRGDGLTLRELAEPDLPGWLARLADAEAAALAGDPVATSMQVVVDGLAHHRAAFRSKEALRWAIVLDETGASVGSVGFGELYEAERRGVLGAAIGREHWGAGIAPRAGRLVVAYGFRELGLSSIEAVVLEHNARVIRVLAKLSFECHGPAAADRAVDDSRGDSLLYVLGRPS